MTRVIVDASITAALILADEASDRDPQVRDALLAGELVVPAHWPVEIASLLLKHQRRGRITADERDDYLDKIGAMLAGVDVVPATLSSSTIALALASHLSAHDAAYLELALQRAATLATNDDELIAVATAHGVPILTTRP